MDLVKLVEEGTYKKEDLNTVNFAFISGMEKAKECLDGMFGDGDFADEWSPELGKIKKEIAETIIEEVKELLYITTCEAIVELVDGQETEVEEGGNGLSETGEECNAHERA